MRILYILHNKSVDGSLLTWINMTDYLMQRGIECSVICEKSLMQFTEFSDFVKKNNISIFETDVQQSVRNFPPSKITQKIKWYWKCITLLRRKFLFFLRLKRIVNFIQPDIIHTNTGVVHEGAFIARFNKIPHVWHLREYQNLGCELWIYPNKRVYDKVLRLSNVVTLTNDIKCHFNLYDYENVKVIPDGVYYESEAVFRMPKEDYFLCVSRIHFQKNLEEAFLAFASFYQENKTFKLLIAGDGDKVYTNQLRKLTESLGISQAVEFLGFCNKSKVRELMQSAKAVLVPSRYEGFGLMTAEAIFNGSIVIGRAEGGTLEILNETGGFLYTSGKDELAENMRLVSSLSDSDYRMLVSRAQKKAIDLYSIEKNGNDILSYYRYLLTK